MMQKRGTTWQSDFAIGVVLLVAAAALPFLDPTTYVIRQLTVFFIWATVVTQWNLVFGVAGIFSLAQLALFAFGGYGTAMMAYFLDWSLWATLPLAALGTVLFSIIIGLACLRLQGPYVALLTLAIAQAFLVLIITDIDCFRMDDTICVQFTGGVQGFTRFGDFGFRDLLGQHWFFGNYYVALVVLALATLVSILVIRSPLGMAFRALSENPAFAVTQGISRFKYQLLAFAVSAFFTGLAGGVYAGTFRVIGPNILFLSLLIYLVAMLVVGGMGRTWGPIAGAAVIMLADEGLKEIVDYRNIGLGAIIVLFIMVFPGGVAGAMGALGGRLAGLWRYARDGPARRRPLD